MAVALFLILLASPVLIQGDSQRGDWYDTYQGDGWSYDTPADALLTGSGTYTPSGQWQEAYTPVKRVETVKKKEEGNFLDKFRNDLTGVGKQIVGGLNKLTGGKLPLQPVAEDRSAEPFIDFDFDFNIGHPKLGYLGNGFHVRAADSEGAPAATSGGYNRNSDLNVEASAQTYSQPELPTSYSNFQTPFVASNPRPQRDSPASNLYDYQEPAHQNFIPVSQPDRSHTDSSSYETPNSGYSTPNSGYEAPASYYTPDSGYSADPSYDQPPYAAPGYEDGAENYYEPVTKPPLHIKIKQDLDSLVDGIVAPIKSLIPGKKTPSSTAASYQLVPASSSYQPVETNQLEPAAYEQEVANRYEPEQSSGGLFATPYGKPPLMEKIRQDFFSWLPKAKREIKVAAAPPPAAAEPEPFYPEYSNLPAKQHYVRQVPAAAPAAAPVPSFLAGDGNVLFKIIPVQTDGAPLYQIVPTSSSPSSSPFPDSRPVVTHSTFTTAASTQTYSHAPTAVHHSQQQPQQPAADPYIPSQPSPQPVVTYTSQVSHPLPPPQQQHQEPQQQQQQQPEPLPLEPAEDQNIFKKVLNNINPRTRTGRKNDIEAEVEAVPAEVIDTAETVFYMSAPDMTKETGQQVIAVVDEPIPGAETHTYEVEMVHEEGRDLTDEVRELLEKVEEIETEDAEREVKVAAAAVVNGKIEP